MQDLPSEAKLDQNRIWDLFDRLNKTRVIEKFRCQVCDDQSFGKYSELQKHIKLLHTEVQNEKSVKGLTEKNI